MVLCKFSSAAASLSLATTFFLPTLPAFADLVVDESFDTTIEDARNSFYAYTVCQDTIPGSTKGCAKNLVTQNPRSGAKAVYLDFRKPQDRLKNPNIDFVDRLDRTAQQSINWIGFSFRIEPGWEFPERQSPQIIYQFHDNYFDPPFSLVFDTEGNLTYGIHSDQKSVKSGILINKNELVLGKWYDVVIQIRPTYRDGIVKLWLDKDSVSDAPNIDYAGPFSEDVGKYKLSKIGMYFPRYRADDDAYLPGTRHIMLFDSYKRGDQNSSFAEVSPRN